MSANIQAASQRAKLTGIAEYLADGCQIGTFRYRPRLNQRYALLHTQELFDRLVNIFTLQFQCHSPIAFRKYLLDAFAMPGGITNGCLEAARTYISCWFWDLYVSNRECVRKMYSTAFNQYYLHDAVYFFQGRYDPFLQHLNAVIRPTRTTHSLEDTIWIPLIRADISWKTDNPFDIIGWNVDKALLYALLDAMEHKNNGWRTMPLSQDDTGRPMWLLDWHDDQAYAWFPMDAHYSMEDLVAAYILGIPCTSNLGPRDRDDWLYFVNHTVPANATAQSLQRGTQRQFFGSAEHRTVDFREWVLPQSLNPAPSHQVKRQKTSLSSTSQLQLTTGSGVERDEQQTSSSEAEDVVTAPQYQITDWCYHAQVISEVNVQRQNSAVRSFLFNI